MSKVEKNQEKDQKQSVSQVLGEQVVNLLHESGIGGLHVEENGLISGETNKLYVYPTTSYLRDIRLVIENGKIVIKAKVTGHSENIGSVI